MIKYCLSTVSNIDFVIFLRKNIDNMHKKFITFQTTKWLSAILYNPHWKNNYFQLFVDDLNSLGQSRVRCSSNFVRLPEASSTRQVKHGLTVIGWKPVGNGLKLIILRNNILQ